MSPRKNHSRNQSTLSKHTALATLTYLLVITADARAEHNRDNHTSPPDRTPPPHQTADLPSPQQNQSTQQTQSPEQQNGTETELPYLLTAGTTDLSVTLRSNPSTGYTWQIISQGNTQCATVELINRQPKNRVTPTVGAPSQTLVKVHALRPGTSRVVLAYSRAWEKNTKPARRITLAITVIPAS